MGNLAAVISMTQVGGRVKMHKNNLQPHYALNVQCTAQLLITTFPQPYPNDNFCTVSCKSLYCISDVLPAEHYEQILARTMYTIAEKT